MKKVLIASVLFATALSMFACAAPVEGEDEQTASAQEAPLEVIDLLCIGLPKCGDGNGSNKIDVGDLTVVSRIIQGERIGKCLRVDVNRDGKVDVTDYTLIQRVVLGKAPASSLRCGEFAFPY